MNCIYELVCMVIISFILSAIICAICETQFNKFLDEINMSKYYIKKNLLLSQRELKTEENELYDKYKSKMLHYTTLFIFVLIILLDINYNIINI